MTRRPIGWYAEKVASREPFAVALVGDGELTVASGAVTSRRYTHYQEMVTPRMVEEMRAVLACREPGWILATDGHLLDPDSYQGQDRAALIPAWKTYGPLLDAYPRDDWHDGVVFDEASRLGDLAPLLKALHDRRLVLVANGALKSLRFWHPSWFVECPPRDAYGRVRDLEKEALLRSRRLEAPAYVLCCGLAAGPLALRLRRARPDAAVLDLGGALDVLAGVGRERGWRAWLYGRPAELAEVVRKNTEGVCACGEGAP